MSKIKSLVPGSLYSVQPNETVFYGTIPLWDNTVNGSMKSILIIPDTVVMFLELIHESGYEFYKVLCKDKVGYITAFHYSLKRLDES